MLTMLMSLLLLAPEVSLRLPLASRIGQFKIAYLSSNTCVATHSWNENFPAYFSLNNWQLPTISQNTKINLLREYWKLCLAKISFLAGVHSHSTMREASPLPQQQVLAQSLGYLQTIIDLINRIVSLNGALQAAANMR